ncbi:sensor histidine kinase [Parapedobacter tibetensis]|uniref:sensor histidine kinase n=1 Tax=Parapedobacter tibetensis TaxID=2972951 RepID=UPI00214D305E|nr:HAMP domain-containing sensor histidine kinase [Parapedobacter tibetensis]
MMSKRIRFIVAIVACSLIGIFLLQGYWLYKSYQLSIQQFDKEVATALERLQDRHTLTDLESMGFNELDTGINRQGKLERMVRFFRATPGFSDMQTPRTQQIHIRDSNYRDSLTTTFVMSMADTGYFDLGFMADSLAPKRMITQRHEVKVNSMNAYRLDELVSFAGGLQVELDSLLRQTGIHSPFAFRLSNLTAGGDEYVKDSILFNNEGNKQLSARIGVLRPYKFELSIGNDVLYILRDMQWVLLASLVIVGITVWAFVYMIRTIFQQKRLSDMKNDFINNMTHEFKTPIATVSLAVEAMKNFDVMNKPEQATEYLDICQHELKRISVMVEKVLKMAAFGRSDMSLAFQKTDIDQLVNDVVANIRPQLEKQAAKLSIKSDRTPVEAMVDRDHISNVVYNLIDNSLKYSDKTPEINITYGVENNSIRLSVSDNGIGIAQVYRERIFENFFRVPTGNIHNVKGFGVGLAYVSAIVKKHHGEITVDSMLGKGSIFTIILPLKQQEHHNN